MSVASSDPAAPAGGDAVADASRLALMFLDDDDDDNVRDARRDGAVPPPEQTDPSSPPSSSDQQQQGTHRLAVGDIHPSALQSLADGTGDGTTAAASNGLGAASGVLGDVTNRSASSGSALRDDDDDEEDDSSSADDEHIVALDSGGVPAAATAPIRRRDAEVPGEELPGAPVGPAHSHHHQPSVLEGARVAAPKPIVRRPRAERRVNLQEALGAVHRIDIEQVHDVVPNPWPISGAEGWWFDARPLLELGTFADPAAHPDDLAGDAPFDIRPAPVGQRAGGHQHQLAVEVARGARGNTYTIYRRDIPVRGLRDVAALPPTVAPFPSVLGNTDANTIQQQRGGGAVAKKTVMAFSGLRTVSLDTARVDPTAFASMGAAARPISIPTRGGGSAPSAASASRNRSSLPAGHPGVSSSPRAQQARPQQPQPPAARGSWAQAAAVVPPPPPPVAVGPAAALASKMVGTKSVAALRPKVPALPSLPSPPRPFNAPSASPQQQQPPPAYRAPPPPPPPPVNASLQQHASQRGGGSKHAKATSSSAAKPTVPARGRAPPPVAVSKTSMAQPSQQHKQKGAVPLPAGISRVVNTPPPTSASDVPPPTTKAGVPPPAGPRFPPPPPPPSSRA